VFPTYDPRDADPWQIDVRGRDLTKLELKDRGADVWHAIFDSHTKWPQQLPPSFEPARLMDLGRNPGLGLRALHAKGVTGKGVGIAILDTQLYLDHSEYKPRLRLYEERGVPEGDSSMHGSAAASLAVGKTVGVAPEAELYYVAFGVGNSESGDPRKYDLTYLAQAMNRMLDLNRSLPKERKIRVITTEIGWQSFQKGYQEVTQAVARAKREGVFVVSSSLDQTFGLRFHGLGRDPLRDPDDPTSYREASFGHAQDDQTLRLPMDARCTAAPTGPKDYAFYPSGGWSWVTPYLAGLYALACQVNPEVTPEVFWAKALETGDPPSFKLPNPPSREEVEKRVAAETDKRIAGLKEQFKGREEELEKGVAESYRRVTGVKKESITLEEAREGFIKAQVEMEMQLSAVTPGKIVNPARLLAALKK